MSQTDYDIDPLDFHDTDTAQAMARDWQGLQPAVLARASQILATEVDRLGARLDESDRLALRLEGERDELREQVAHLRKLLDQQDGQLRAVIGQRGDVLALCDRRDATGHQTVTLEAVRGYLHAY
jgi:hypothetical protein